MNLKNIITYQRAIIFLSVVILFFYLYNLREKKLTPTQSNTIYNDNIGDDTISNAKRVIAIHKILGLKIPEYHTISIRDGYKHFIGIGDANCTIEGIPQEDYALLAKNRRYKKVCIMGIDNKVKNTNAMQYAKRYNQILLNLVLPSRSKPIIKKDDNYTTLDLF